MKDTLSAILWGALLVLVSIVGGLLLVLFIALIMASLALPLILVIWAIGALL